MVFCDVWHSEKRDKDAINYIKPFYRVYSSTEQVERFEPITSAENLSEACIQFVSMTGFWADFEIHLLDLSENVE